MEFDLDTDADSGGHVREYSRWARSAAVLLGLLGVVGCSGKVLDPSGPRPAVRATLPGHDPTTGAPPSTTATFPLPSRSTGGPPARTSAGRTAAGNSTLRSTGTAVPTDFKPVSATAISATTAWVLGTAACAGKRCPAVVQTTDGFASFTALSAPEATIDTQFDSNDPATVRELRFGDINTGYAFGPGLFSTHDGGKNWHELTVNGRVSDLAISGGFTYLVVDPCPASSTDCSLAGSLRRAPLDSDTFTQVLSTPAATGGTLTLHGRTGYLATQAAQAPANGDSTVLYATTDGDKWSRVADPCAVLPNNAYALDTVSAVDATYTFALCSGEGGGGQTKKAVVASDDTGKTWVKVGEPPPAGDGGDLEAASRRTLVIASTSAASYLYRSSDGGRTWTSPEQYGDGGEGFGDIGFTTPSQAFALRGVVPQSAPTLIVTTDAGETWRTVSIR